MWRKQKAGSEFAPGYLFAAHSEIPSTYSFFFAENNTDTV